MTGIRAILLLVCLGGLAACGAARPVPDLPFAELVTRERLMGARVPLREDPRLTATAHAHARDLAARGVISHKGQDGSTVQDRMRAQGYDACLAAENLAARQRTEQEVFGDWRGSRDHRQNLMHRKARDYGLARSGDTWVMVIGAPCDAG